MAALPYPWATTLSLVKMASYQSFSGKEAGTPFQQCATAELSLLPLTPIHLFVAWQTVGAGALVMCYALVEPKHVLASWAVLYHCPCADRAEAEIQCGRLYCTASLMGKLRLQDFRSHRVPTKSPRCFYYLFSSARGGIQGFVHARQSFYH